MIVVPRSQLRKFDRVSREIVIARAIKADQTNLYLSREDYELARLSCPRCGGKHTIEACPIPPDYSPETSATSPKRRGCCDKATNPQD